MPTTNSIEYMVSAYSGSVAHVVFVGRSVTLHLPVKPLVENFDFFNHIFVEHIHTFKENHNNTIRMQKDEAGPTTFMMLYAAAQAVSGTLHFDLGDLEHPYTLILDAVLSADKWGAVDAVFDMLRGYLIAAVPLSARRHAGLPVNSPRHVAFIRDVAEAYLLNQILHDRTQKYLVDPHVFAGILHANVPAIMLGEHKREMDPTLYALVLLRFGDVESVIQKEQPDDKAPQLAGGDDQQ